MKCAQDFGHQFVGTEHLLFALVSQENTAATVILENMKVNPEDIKEQIIEAFERGRSQQQQQQQMGQMMNPLEFFLNGLQGVLVGNMEKDQYKDAYKHKKQSQSGSSKTEKAQFVNKVAAKLGVSTETVWKDVAKIKEAEKSGEIVKDVGLPIPNLERLMAGFVFLEESRGENKEGHTRKEWQKIAGQAEVDEILLSYQDEKEALSFLAEQHCSKESYPAG
jgi:ATP-dependent Clp protease ATP-binding subunit ClpA